MDSLETLAAGVKHVDSLLDEAALEPDAARTDWDRMKVRVGMVRDGLDREVFAVLDDALESAEESEDRPLIKRRVATLLGSAAALLEASGDGAGAAKLRGRARDLSTEEDQKAELGAGDREPRLWAMLQHARWLLMHQRRAQAERTAKSVARESKEEALRTGARHILRAPRPLQSAPPLFRINGCGVGLYGERDRTPDGWYVATYCICILFIPVLPLTAYRVRRVDQGWSFIAREPLGPLARIWQILVAGGAAVALAVTGVTGWLDSPGHKAHVAMEAGRAAEARGDRDGALERYSEVTRLYEGSGEVGAAAEAMIRLSAAGVPDPCTAAAVDKVGRVVDTYQALPGVARTAAAEPLVKRLEGWAAQIGEADLDQVNAGLTVLDMAARVAEGTNASAGVEGRRAKLRRSLAGKVADTRPLRALALYASPPADPDSLAAAGTIVDSFAPGSTLWLEAEPDVLAWAVAAEKQAGMREAAKRARDRLAAARTQREASSLLIENGNEKQLAAELAKQPGDQDLAAALAQQQRRRGDLKAALATLGALGPPGRLTALAQQLLAMCHADAGELGRAQAVLRDLLAERLPAFQEAQRELTGATERVQHRIIEDAKAGHIDPAVERKLKSASEAERPALIRAWLQESLAADPELKRLQAEYLRHHDVVPASLALGQIELRRANAASGEERRALLASAEKTFLSIHNEAEGNPSYHLGLGQVYHRLGRFEEGNQELSRLLERKDPEITLSVVRVYRDLGLSVRAKQIAEDLWNTASDDKWKKSAAVILSHLVNEVGNNEDEEEMWLKRSDSGSDQIQLLLLGLEARRARRQGRTADADRTYARIIEGYEKGASRVATDANNAAIAYEERYSVSGDPAHLRAAAKHLEAAHRLSPQDALVVGNLGDVLAQLAGVTVLERWVKTRTLALGSHEVQAVIGAMLAGPLRAEVLAALRKDPSFHRSLDVAQEEQTLAPQKAGGYERQIRWLVWSEDASALADLQKRLAAMPPFDSSTVAASRASRLERSKDALHKGMAEQSLARAEETVRRAEREGHAPTIAVARYVQGMYEGWLAEYEASPARLDGWIESQRKAAQGWPEGAMDEALAATLAKVGLHRAAAESPEVKKALSADERIFGLGMMLHRMTRGADGAAASEALRRRPEIVEAAKVSKARAQKRPQILDVVLARLVGDTEAEQAANAVFQRAEEGASLNIEGILAPGQEVEQTAVEFWKAGPKR